MHFPVTVEMQPSRRLRAALVFVHLAAAASLALALPPLPALAAIPFLSISLAWCWRGMRAAALTLKPDGTIALRRPDGRFYDGDVLADSTAFRSLLVLRVRVAEEARSRALVIAGDSVSGDDFRRLQIWLRWVQPFRRRTAA